MAYHRQQGVNTAIVRIFNTYGPRMRAYDGRAIPTFMRQALENKPLTVFGQGSQTRSFCYVDDLDSRDLPARGERRAPPRQPRQPKRVHDPRARGDRDPPYRVVERDRVRGASRRRPADQAARHHPREAASRVGARDPARGGASQNASDPGAGPCVGTQRWRPGSRRGCSCAADRAVGCASFPEGAQSRALITGIFDESQTLGNADWAFPQYKTLGVEALRVNLYWGGPSGVAHKKRPANARNPADPAYDWTVYDAFVKRAAENRIKPVFSILWTPIVGRPREEHGPAPHDRPPQLCLRRGQALQRQLPSRPERPGASGRALLARVERAQQPGLPEAAVPEDRPARVPAREPADLRRDVQRDHVRRSPDRPPRREGRLRRDRTARQQHRNAAASVRVAAHLPARPEAGPRALRRLRASPVLPAPERVTRASRRPARARSRSATSTS